jgi:tripartite-type tricarboxylate transporter receptor subunit TctC
MILNNRPKNTHATARYPTAPVTIVVPFTSGAANDQVARFMAAELSIQWRQPVHVVNKPGGNAIIGTQIVMSASPDGYTILMESIGSSSSQMGLKNLPYDPSRRTFLARTCTVPLVFITSRHAPWQSLKELAEAGRNDPSSIVWGAASGGGGAADSVLLRFFEAAGIDVPETRRVDFDGSSGAIAAVAEGQVELHAAAPAAVFPSVSSGEARALGLTTPTRTSLLPDVPTTREAGFPTVDNTTWKGFSGPPDMPAHVREIFVRTVEEIVKDPRVVEQLAKRFDAVPAFLRPEAFERSVREEANVVERLQKLLTGGK